jgi:glucose/arabinose dehydrogenase
MLRDVALLLCLPGAVLLSSSSALAAIAVPSNFVSESIVTGLNQPNSLAFIPDGRIVYTEQMSGRVRLIANGHVSPTIMLTVPSLNISGYERGLQGVAVDPAWPSRPYVYLAYDRIGNFIRVVRYTATGDVNNPTGESLPLTDPAILIDNIPDNANNHNAGCLRFSPDGSLFVSVGEDADKCGAQDLAQLKGKLLRLWVADLPPGPRTASRAQIIPQDNPIASPDSNTSLVWATGLRNPWRFHIDPATLKAYVCDPGEATYEEIDEVTGGSNQGWPWREGPMVVPMSTCPEPGGSGSQSFSSPIVSVSHDGSSQAIVTAGIRRTVIGGQNNWPNTYNGMVFFGDYYAGYLRRVQKSGSTWTAVPAAPGQPDGTNWATGLKSESDFVTGPDGSLYWVRQFDDTFSGATGSLGRIRYTGPPLSVATTTGDLALSVSPNPSTNQARLGFALPQASNVRLEIFDLLGRRVRTLIDGPREEGRTEVVWDGSDEQGGRARPGVYLARLHTGAMTSRAHVLRIE